MDMPTRIVLLLMFCHQISAWEFLYSEMDCLGGSCYPRDSCGPPRNEEDDHLWKNYSCECGTHCIRSATCCADSEHVGDVFHLTSRSETCQKLTSMSDAVMAVSTCSDRWRYGYIRDKCEKNLMEKEDPMAADPVTSLATFITYKNYFCAVCNYDARNVFMWNIALQYANKESIDSLSNVTDDYLLRNLVFDDDLRSWGIKDSHLVHEIKIQYSLPTSLLKVVKKCYLNMESQCNSLYRYPHELQLKCLSYYSPIKIRTELGLRKFRNIHCALCNGINVTEMDSSKCKLDKGGKKKQSFSFALLLDINQKDGDLVGKKKLCEDNASWDPFFKKCRTLTCALPGHVIKGGKCVQN